MLFRARGLQVLRNEADEMDTGKSCTLIITPQAPLVSGVIIRILKIMKPVLAEDLFKSETDKLLQRIKRHATSPAGTWEDAACLDLVKMALEIKVTLPKPNQQEDSFEHPNGDFVDPFTGEPFGFMAHHRRWLRKRMVSEEGMSDDLLDATLGATKGHMKKDKKTNWLKVAGVAGFVIESYWIPILSPGLGFKKSTINKIVRALGRRRLNTKWALVLLLNHVLPE